MTCVVWRARGWEGAGGGGSDVLLTEGGGLLVDCSPGGGGAWWIARIACSRTLSPPS